MKFKMIIAIVQDVKTDLVINAARENGATGCTVITSARGEGLTPAKTFLGLTVEGQRDLVLMMVEEHLSRHILEAISTAAGFEAEPGTGIAVTIDLEDAVGFSSQIKTIEQEIESEI
ncbi:MAG: transcriptional regulator [Hyphomicrobiales bacterium]|nr:MAG: transcriptional regulator [Hyphomicrobiales bacterium]